LPTAVDGFKIRLTGMVGLRGLRSG